VLFAGPSNYAMAKLLTGADEVIRVPVNNPWQAIRVLRSQRLDVLCDFGPWPRLNAICAALSGARFLIGFRTAGQHRHYVYDRIVEHSSRTHEIDNQRALARALGVESKSLPSLSVNAPLPEPLMPETYIVFHAWSAGYLKDVKEWPMQYWVELAETVSSLVSVIVLTGGPADVTATQQLCGQLAERTSAQVVNLCGVTSLPETIAVLARAVAVISVNTGIIHLAAAVGAPILSLDGPVNSKRWRPIGNRAISLGADIPGCGYLNLGFESDGHRIDCMALIKPERVFQALTELLDSASRSPQEAAPGSWRCQET
jgi:heptosyltransferase-3